MLFIKRNKGLEKLKVAQLTPVEETVPPPKYGGTELVAANLTNGLVANGHNVTLLASGDSSTRAKLAPTLPQAIRKITQRPEDDKLREAYKYKALGQALSSLTTENFDIIHDHVGWRFLSFKSLLNIPVVTTLHGPLSNDFNQKMYSSFPGANYVTISNAQRKPLPNLNFVGTVYNGIDVESFTYNDKPGDYFAFLGRMSPEKGPKEAILAAKAAGVPLVMAAKVDAVDQAYFEKEIKPLIDGKQIKFIGEVDHSGKVELLRNARALLALIQWEEPFGLFIVEALACGTPVIATGRGSVPELLEDGTTGFIVGQDLKSAIDAIPNVDRLSRTACRESATDRFSINTMVAGYEKIYAKIIAENKHPEKPRTRYTA